jgi:hypothetical protein
LTYSGNGPISSLNQKVREWRGTWHYHHQLFLQQEQQQQVPKFLYFVWLTLFVCSCCRTTTNKRRQDKVKFLTSKLINFKHLISMTLRVKILVTHFRYSLSGIYMINKFQLLQLIEKDDKFKLIYPINFCLKNFIEVVVIDMLHNSLYSRFGNCFKWHWTKRDSFRNHSMIFFLWFWLLLSNFGATFWTEFDFVFKLFLTARTFCH